MRIRDGAARSLPYAAVAAAHGTMLAVAVREDALLLWAGGAAISAALLLRRRNVPAALTDGLTGLADHRGFHDAVDGALARASSARAGKHTAVLMIDLNGFRAINAALGHHAGDRALGELADVLRACVPATGLPCRLGADAFAVVLPDLDFAEQAYEVAGRIVATLGPVVIAGRLTPMAAGIGVAVSRPGELGADELVRRAAVAMERAKANGPQTRWAVWRESFEQTAAA